MTIVNLPDGRDLDLEVSGPEDGVPLVFHHGTPGSVRQFRAIQRAAHDRGLRLVTFSRPGYGASTRQPGRRVVDVVADVAAVLTHLGAPRCLVAGWSGGGPHALATGSRLPEQVAGILCIAGVAPYDAEGLNFLEGMGQQNIDEFGLALQGEEAIRPSNEAEAVGLRNTDAAGLIEGMATLLPDVDRAVLTAEFGEDMVANFAEGLRTGVDGWVDDLAFAAPWALQPGRDRRADLRVARQRGPDGAVRPRTMACRARPRCDGTTAQAEGHLSIGVGALDRMFDDLLTTISD